MQKIDWSAIEDAPKYEKPKPGGYIAKIVGVTDNEEKEYLSIEWDFIDGPLAGYNERTFEYFGGRWPYILIRSYKHTALRFFKAFKTALEASNPGYHFDEDDLQSMVGKKIGIVLGEEEYNGKIRLRAEEAHSVATILKGLYKIPSVKREKKQPKTDEEFLSQFASSAGFVEIVDTEAEQEGEEVLPF